MALVIRREQREAFRRAAAEWFVDRALSDLRGRFPAEVLALGDDAVRSAIREGIDRAEASGVEVEIDVIRFIRFMFLLGRRFDDDARYPWIREVMADRWVPASVKMLELCRLAERELGPESALRVR